MTRPYKQLSQLIRQVKDEMHVVGIYSETPPSAEALASTMPFCYDTMEFSGWLQWIFIPRIEQILDQGLQLPGKCEIAPLAEVWFQERYLEQQARHLLALLEEIDRLITSVDSPV